MAFNLAALLGGAAQGYNQMQQWQRESEQDKLARKQYDAQMAALVVPDSEPLVEEFRRENPGYTGPVYRSHFDPWAQRYRLKMGLEAFADPRQPPPVVEPYPGDAIANALRPTRETLQGMIGGQAPLGSGKAATPNPWDFGRQYLPNAALPPPQVPQVPQVPPLARPAANAPMATEEILQEMQSRLSAPQVVAQSRVAPPPLLAAPPARTATVPGAALPSPAAFSPGMAGQPLSQPHTPAYQAGQAQQMPSLRELFERTGDLETAQALLELARTEQEHADAAKYRQYADTPVNVPGVGTMPLGASAAFHLTPGVVPKKVNLLIPGTNQTIEVDENNVPASLLTDQKADWMPASENVARFFKVPVGTLVPKEWESEAARLANAPSFPTAPINEIFGLSGIKSRLPGETTPPSIGTAIVGGYVRGAAEGLAGQRQSEDALGDVAPGAGALPDVSGGYPSADVRARFGVTPQVERLLQIAWADQEPSPSRAYAVKKLESWYGKRPEVLNELLPQDVRRFILNQDTPTLAPAQPGLPVLPNPVPGTGPTVPPPPMFGTRTPAPSPRPAPKPAPASTGSFSVPFPQDKFMGVLRAEARRGAKGDVAGQAAYMLKANHDAASKAAEAALDRGDKKRAEEIRQKERAQELQIKAAQEKFDQEPDVELEHKGVRYKGKLSTFPAEVQQAFRKMQGADKELDEAAYATTIRKAHKRGTSQGKDGAAYAALALAKVGLSKEDIAHHISETVPVSVGKPVLSVIRTLAKEKYHPKETLPIARRLYAEGSKIQGISEASLTQYVVENLPVRVRVELGSP